MKYKILIGKSKKAKVEVNIDVKAVAVPPSVFLGVGDKKKRFKAVLDKCLSSDDQYMLRYLAHIHKQGNENGDVTLVCKCQMKSFHAQCIKEWIEENAQTLDMMIPYLFSNQGYTMKKLDLDSMSEEEKAAHYKEFGGQSNNAVLPKADMDIIQDLIRQDQERQKLKATDNAELVNETIIEPALVSQV